MEHRIKDVIKEKGYTQQQFAEKLEITRGGLIQLLESPSYPSLEKIATALNVPMWQLFASPEEVKGNEEDKNTITCPKCGSKFKMEE